MSEWKPGDRVIVGSLRSHDRLHRGRQWAGTVVEVDPPGRRRGVLVQLDHLVNGVDNCYATHDELRPVSSGEDSPR